jgi:hypothetical protein
MKPLLPGTMGFDRGDVTDEEGKDLVRENLATLAAVGAVPADAADTEAVVTRNNGLVERSKGADVGERAIETRDMSHAGIVLSWLPSKEAPSRQFVPASCWSPYRQS